MLFLFSYGWLSHLYLFIYFTFVWLALPPNAFLFNSLLTKPSIFINIFSLLLLLFIYYFIFLLFFTYY
ncbi:hypothetical protein ACMBCN_00240 [Candidatus Liberibacter asiaticus]|nr:hypothetical protein [Candidatus Liberibacter asiaticus]